MKQLKHKKTFSTETEQSLAYEHLPYEIVFADARDEEINLKFLKKSQISAHMARWFLDQEYNQLIWSDGIFEILELDARKYGANFDTFLEMVHPDDRELKLQAHDNLKKTFKPIELNYRLLFGDGRIKWINEICNTDFDQKGNPTRSYGTIQDITKYKLTEENFRQQEVQFLGLINAIPTGIALIQDSKFVFVNSAAQMILGGNTQVQLNGKNISNIALTGPKKILLKKIKSVAQGNQESSFEDKLKRLDNSGFDAEITLIPATFHGLPAVQFIVNDITKRKRTEEALRKNEEEFRVLAANLTENEIRLNDLVATKDKFFSVIAHDLRSPFNSIIGFLDLIQNEYDNIDDDEKKSYLKLIDDDTKNTLKLLDNLLEWAKVQTGKISFQPVKQKLVPILENVKETYKSALNVKQLNVNYSIPEEMEVVADTKMLTSIFRNLIGNAIKYSLFGGVISISAEMKNDRIEFVVSDTGTGMSEEIRKNIFSINGQVSVPGTANEIGSGLGLILCKDFIEKHRGAIWVESELGIGSKFTFTIPYINS